MSARRHVPALDGIRGIAILLVIVFHAGKLHAGWLGVDLFFVLSGFLITGILLRAKDAPHYFRNFWGRRVLRIFPPYYAYLLLTLAILPALGLVPHGTGHGWVLAFLTNWPLARHGSWGTVPLGTQHLWSVAIEEQFYLLWPVAVWLLSQRALRALCIVGIVAALLVRLGLYEMQWTTLAYAVFTPARLDALLVGAWLAISPWRPPRLAIAAAIAFLLVVLAAGIDGNDATRLIYGYTLIAVAAGTLIAGAVSEPRVARVLSWQPLRVAGKYSYTGYLIHLLIVEQLQDTFHVAAGTWQFLALVLVATFGIAALSWRVYERPILALKDRFFPEPDAPIPVPIEARPTSPRVDDSRGDRRARRALALDDDVGHR